MYESSGSTRAWYLPTLFSSFERAISFQAIPHFLFWAEWSPSVPWMVSISLYLPTKLQALGRPKRRTSPWLSKSYFITNTEINCLKWDNRLPTLSSPLGDLASCKQYYNASCSFPSGYFSLYPLFSFARALCKGTAIQMPLWKGHTHPTDEI